MKDYLGRKLKIFDLVWDINGKCFAIIVGNKEIYSNVNGDKIYNVDEVLLINAEGDDILIKQKDTLSSRYKLYADMGLKLKKIKSDVGAVYISNNIYGDLYLSLGKANLYKDGILINTGYTYIPISMYNNKRVKDLHNQILTQLFVEHNIYPSKSDISFLKHKKSNLSFSTFLDITPIFGESGKYSWTFIHCSNNSQTHFTLELLEYNKKE